MKDIKKFFSNNKKKYNEIFYDKKGNLHVSISDELTNLKGKVLNAQYLTGDVTVTASARG